MIVSGSRFSKFLWCSVLGLLVLRLIYLPFFCSAFDLVGDESYYWEWGRRPDWGYFSKPPMIGWLMGVVGVMTHHAEWGIRLASLLCGTVSLGLLYALAKRMFDQPTALLTVFLAAFTPANIALNLFFTIDAPLVLCWTAALLGFWRAIEAPEKTQNWVWLTLALGMGNLSKQMMLVFPLLMLLLVWWSKAARPVVRQRGFWISIGISLLFVLPVLWWNEQHDWITFQHTSHHFDTKVDATLWERFTIFLTFPLFQMGLLTPLIWGLLMAVGFGGLWKWRQLDLRSQYLVIFSAPALMVFSLLALRQSINPNWPAVYYLSGMTLVAAALQGTAVPAWPRLAWSRWFKPTTIMAFVITLAAYAFPLTPGILALAGYPGIDPFARVKGWREAGEAAGKFYARAPAPEKTFFLVMGHRENASQLSFYTPQHPPLYRWQEEDITSSQYELWPQANEERMGGDALIFIPDGRGLAKSMARSFETVEKVGDINIPLGNEKARTYGVYLGRNLISWPKPKLPRSPGGAAVVSDDEGS